MGDDSATRRIGPIDPVGDNAATRPLGPIEVGATLPMAAPETSELPFGVALGRYLVLGVLGRGGMGIVYEAYDPVLDRKIAVKLLRVSDEEATDGRARMQREAQALARLSHPNVIAVHDVGEHGGATYIAMELVRGKTLRDWQDKRPWRDVLGVYLAAARGLAAAHEAGLVHRDFKPDNVLVGDDGRVRVTDFGLARLAADAPLPASPASPSQLASNLTEAGAVMGTLAYMAPEQIDGGSVDARTDQCAWCISAWEALYGEQPFIAGNLALRSAAMKTDVPRPPAGTRVPRAVARALLRGLAPDPARRWPQMRELARELERATRSRTPYVAGAAVAAAAVVAGVLAFGRHAAAPAGPDCRAAGTPIDALWSPEARASVERAFTATGAPFAHDAMTALDRAIGAWSARWRRDAIDSCEATRVRGVQSVHVLDLRTACLDRARHRLSNTVAALAQADRKLVADSATLALPDLDACGDVAVLVGEAPPPKDAAARKAIEARLDGFERELDGGLSIPRATAMIPEVEAVRGDATKLGWPPLVARTDRDLARAQYELGHGKDVRAALLAAAASASAAGDPDALAEIYLTLAENEAKLTSSFALGDAWVELAAGTLAHVGPRPTKQVAIARARGLVAERAGRAEDARAAYADALALARPLGPHDELGALIDLSRAEADLDQLAPARDHDTRALALARAELGDHHPTVGRILHDLGTIAYRAGDYAGAETWFDRALAIRQADFGPDSVEVANTIEAKGNAELAMDQLGPAQEHFAQAIHLLEARLGPDNPDVANAYNDIGGAYHRAGHYEEALANAEKVLALREQALGPDHPDVAQSLVNEAIEAKNLGKWSYVDANYPRALAIFQKAYGKDSFEVGVTLINLGEARRAQGQLDAAEAAYDRARDVLAKQLGESHPVLAHVWNGLGQVALARGKLDDAVPLLERAVSIREHAKTDATDLAESRFALARAIAGKDRARAVQLAAAARDVYRGAGPGYASRLAAVEAWLASCATPDRPCPAR